MRGASTRCVPDAANLFPMFRTTEGELVVRSTSTLPDPAQAPSHASATASMASGVGSDRNVMSAALATSATEPAPEPPASVNGATLLGSMSKTVSR